jgi:hypothetical protein
MSNRIFISHSGADKQWVRDFAKSLRQQGSDVWLDEVAFKPGESVPQAMEKGLRESDMVVFVVTPESVRSNYLLFELGAAIGMGKRAIPILAGNVSPSDLPFPLRSRVSLPKESPDETAKKVLAATSPDESA